MVVSGPCAFPQARLLRWAGLGDAQFNAELQRLGLIDAVDGPLTARRIREHLDALFSVAGGILRAMPLEQVQAHAAWALEQLPGDPLARDMAAAMIAAAQANERVKARASATARKNASGPRATHAAKIKPYVDIWLDILRSGRFAHLSGKALASAQAREFDRACVMARREPVSTPTRNSYKRQAQAELSQIS
jgi:hypothetical protein